MLELIHCAKKMSQLTLETTDNTGFWMHAKQVFNRRFHAMNTDYHSWPSGKTARNTYKESIKEAILQANTALNESMYLVLARTLFTNILVEVQLTHEMEMVVRLPFSFSSSSCPFFVDVCFRFLKSRAMCALKLSNMQKNMRKSFS